MSRHLWLSAALICLTSAAHAGPWTLEKGRHQLIISVETGEESQDFDLHGDRAQGMRRFTTVSARHEYGFTDAITAGALIEGKQIKLDSDGAGGSASGVSKSGFWVRARLWRSGGMVFSTQLSAAFSPEQDQRTQLSLSGGAYEVEARALAGYGLETALGGAWMAIEGAYRLQDDETADQIRLDGVIGLRPEIHPGFLAILNAQGVFAAEDAKFGDYDVIKISPSIAYELTQKLTVQAGVTHTLHARNISRPNVVTISFWMDF